MERIKKNVRVFVVTVLLAAIGGSNLYADDRLINMSLEDLLNIELQSAATEGIAMYGYMNTNIEKVFGELSVDGSGNTVKTDAPLEMSTPHFNLFLKAPLSQDIETFINISGENPIIQNMWGNIAIHKWLQFRMGKMYRRFGLFNEKLDAVPTYLGIEPPELFDGDHLLLPRLTTLMVHGETEAGEDVLSYALSTDNGEGGAAKDVIPLGWDVRANLKNLQAVIGLSGYFSSIGSGKDTTSDTLGAGSPSGGILPWMTNDDYKVIGIFAEKQINHLLIKAAFYQAEHKALRNATSVATVAANTTLSARQLERFFGSATAAQVAGNVVPNVDYTVQTGYLRLGYYFDTKRGTVAPYLFYDWMENPETIAKKTWGGDNECGISDDGKFTKWSLGVLYKPIEKVAIKVDSSLHVQKFNGKTESYPETRFDVSFLFK